MKDTYLDGVERAKIDDKIDAIAKKTAKKEMGGMPMVTAVQNEKGEVYRVITVDGLSAYIALVQSIAGLGLEDVHKDNLNPGKYDSLFVFK